jgi:hypothetical protein
MNWIRRVRNRLQPIVGGIDQTWSHDGYVGIRGWLIHKKGRLRSATIEVDGVAVPVTNWHPRTDIRKMLPGVDEETLEHCGFWVQLPRLARHKISLAGSDGSSQGRIDFSVNGSVRPGEDEQAVAGRTLFNRFIQQVNENRMHVLEIGSRIVAPGSASKRGLFGGAASYTGFDYYGDPNTDVVGDAHRLSEYFPERKFDAVFSYSVLEHLAMPWVFPIEVNRVLTNGGLTFHHTHFAWPQHEVPWDFWRFSDGGLRVLFSGVMGFEVVEAGMFEPLHMYLDHPGDGQETFPEFPAYAGSVVLARKVSNVNPGRGAWDVDVAEACEGTAYPRRE